MTNEDKQFVTPSTPSTMTRTTTTHAICTSEHSSAPLVVFHVSLMMCPHHNWLKSFMCLSISSSRHVYVRFSLTSSTSLSTSTCPSPVFFHSSVLMHLDNLDSVENNLRHSAKGEPRRLRRPPSPSQVMSPTTRSPNELVDSQGPLLLRYSVIGPGHR